MAQKIFSWFKRLNSLLFQKFLTKSIKVNLTLNITIFTVRPPLYLIQLALTGLVVSNIMEDELYKSLCLELNSPLPIFAEPTWHHFFGKLQGASILYLTFLLSIYRNMLLMHME